LPVFSDRSTLSPAFPPGSNPIRSTDSRLRQHLGSIVSAAISAVDARRVTGAVLESLVDSLTGDGPLFVVAAGKAAMGMAQAAQAALGNRIAAGLVTAPAAAFLPRWQAIAATHPHPSSESEAAGRAALALAARARREHGQLLVCLSGGASAMLAVPADGLGIEDKAATTAALLRAKLDIGAVNTVRRHLSAIKGGQLAATAGRTITLAISDVCVPVEDDPAAIGSGPTVGDRSTFADAVRIVEDADLRDAIPPAAMRHLLEGAEGRRNGPVAPTDPVLAGSAYWLIASRRDAMRAASLAATRLGYQVVTIDEPTIGEAREAGPALVARAAAEAHKHGRPLCLVASGETTVLVKGSGRGGRNQELAVASLEALAALGPAAMASIGTDGVDGPTDAAGALIDDDCFAQLGPSPHEVVSRTLDDNDALPLLDRLGALVRSGPTGTNVGDLQVILLAGS
jgi:glycerate 2-kinase